VLLLLGAGGIYALLRRRQDGTPALPLNEAERSRLAELMAENAEAPLGGREPGQG
jgi:hypothetical protein